MRPVSGKLGLMRWRGIPWALAGGLGLALVLCLACHPGAIVAPSAGMSAPPVSSASLDSAPAPVQQSPFGWQPVLPRTAGLPPAPAVSGVSDGARQHGSAITAHYGPLYRRPPPSFS